MKINPTRAVFSLGVLLVFLSANKLPETKLKYSPYEIMVWEIKANEGFVPHWYPDGKVRGRQSYSIGFGWNDQGSRRTEAKPFLNSNGKITFQNATKLTLYEISKYGQLSPDPLKNVALRLYSYSRGLTKNGSSLGKCCGARWGCGNASKNIRKSHSRRRTFELACWNRDIKTINRMTEENRQKVIAMGR